MQQENSHKQTEPMLSFHLMKFAFQDFQKTASSLTPKEYTLAYQHAHEEMLLHKVILSSDDACCVVIPETTIEQTLKDVIAEYPDDATFHRNIKANNMEIDEYTMALHNDLRVEAILSRIASAAQPITADEILHYFNENQSKFTHLEQKCLQEATPTILPILQKKKQLEVCRLWLQKLIQPKQ